MGWTSVITLPMESVGPHGQNDPFSRSNEPRAEITYGASWSSRPKWPILKGQTDPRAGKPPILPIFNFDIIFAKILPGRPLRPYLWSQLTLTAKTAHFQGQKRPRAGPYLRSPHGQNVPFSRSKEPYKGKPPNLLIFVCKSMHFLVIQNSDLIFTKILPRHPLIPYLQSHLSLTAKTTHFQGQKRPRADLIFGANWTVRLKQPILKTLPTKLVDPDGQNDQILKSNEPQSRRLLRPYLWIQLPFTAKMPIFKVKQALEHSMNFLVIRNFDLILAKILPGRSLRPYLWSQLTLTAKMTNFQWQTSPRAVHGFFGEPEFDLIYAKILPGCPLRPYLRIQFSLMDKTAYFQGQKRPRVVDPHGQNGPFQGQQRPRVDLTYGASWPARLKQLIFKVKRDLERSRDFLGIHNFDLIFAKTLPGRPLRPYQWIQLALTDKTFYFQGQMSLKAGKPPLLPIFMCYSSPSFLNFDLIFAKILPGRPLRPYIWSQLALTAKMAHFQGQKSPRVARRSLSPYLRSHLSLTDLMAHLQGIFRGSRIPTSFLPKFYMNVRYDLTYGASWSSGPKWPILKVKRTLEKLTIFFGNPKFRSHFCQNFTWMSVKTLPTEQVGPHGHNNPFSMSNMPEQSQLALTAKMAHFQGQKSPITAICPSRPNELIFNVKRGLEQSMNFLVIWNFDLIFAKILPGRPLKPYLWSQLALMAKMAHFQDLIYKASWPSLTKRPIFKVKQSPEQLAHTTKTAKRDNFQGQKRPRAGHFCQNLTWTSVKTLPMEPTGPHDQNDLFSRSNES
ncbi:hypothetical protein H5410_039383 [Solanum commersonii]|uniref:Uncharacterized protein n=1 Tax=Solanum commersonii TaxID=4109 RepID=A0A9J5XLY4_SOLCO|nr:hypothetical protein H5410_039383 [Solanum commersonii]